MIPYKKIISKVLSQGQDTHIYENHVSGLKMQLERLTKDLPKIKTKNFSSIFHWEYTDTELSGYQHHPGIKFDIAV